MTNTEFNNQFDLLYSNNANVGPGLDAYDKSVFLTMAQDEILNNYYSPKSNRKFEGFEASEKRRRDLDALAVSAIAINPTQNSFNVNSHAYNFLLNDNVAFIINERIKVIPLSSCVTDVMVDVIPMTHDELNLQISNPFKNPDRDTAWRLDISNTGSLKMVEIVGSDKYTPLEYHYRYIKKPAPIILENLPSGLSIDGISTQTACELQPVANEILNRAVELALEVAGNPRMKTKVELDTRNE